MVEKIFLFFLIQLSQAPQLLHPLQVRRKPQVAQVSRNSPVRKAIGSLKSDPFRRTKFVLRHPALKAQARKVRLSALHPLVGYAVLLSVLDEHRAGLDEVERDVVSAALVAQPLRPFIMARPRPVVVLPAAEDLLELAGGKVAFGIVFANQGLGCPRLPGIGQRLFFMSHSRFLSRDSVLK